MAPVHADETANARGPPLPGEWTIVLTDGIDHLASITTSGEDLVVTVDGIAMSRPLAGLERVTVIGGDRDDSLVVITAPVPIFYDGRGGFDLLTIEGVHGSVRATAIDGTSGTILLDGLPVTYAGLEPIILSGTATDVVIDGSASDDAIVVSQSGSTITVATSTGDDRVAHLRRPDELARDPRQRRHRLGDLHDRAEPRRGDADGRGRDDHRRRPTSPRARSR